MDDGRKAKAKHSIHLALRDDFFKPSTLGSCIRVSETQQVRDSVTGADVQHVLATHGDTIPRDGIEVCKTRTWSSVLRIGPLESSTGEGCQAVTFESYVGAVPSSGYQTPLKSAGVVEVHSKSCKRQDDEDGSEDHMKTYKGSGSDYKDSQHEEYDSGGSSYWKGEKQGDKKHGKNDGYKGRDSHSYKPKDSHKPKNSYNPHAKKDTDSYKQKKDSYGGKDSYSGTGSKPGRSDYSNQDQGAKNGREDPGADDGGEGYDGPDEQYAGSGNGGGNGGILPSPGAGTIPPLPGSYSHGGGIPPLPGTGLSDSGGFPPLPGGMGGGGSFRGGEAADDGVHLPVPDPGAVQQPVGLWLPQPKQADIGNSRSELPHSDSSRDAADGSDGSSNGADISNPGVWLPPVSSSGSGSFSLGDSQDDSDGSGEGFDDNQPASFWGKGSSKFKALIPGLGREKLVTSSLPQPSLSGAAPQPAYPHNVLSADFWVALAKASEAAAGQTLPAAKSHASAAHTAVGVAAATAASNPAVSTAANPAPAAVAGTAAAPAEKRVVQAAVGVAAAPASAVRADGQAPAAVGAAVPTASTTDATAAAVPAARAVAAAAPAQAAVKAQ
jgi:hypothetical protein